MASSYMSQGSQSCSHDLGTIEVLAATISYLNSKIKGKIPSAMHAGWLHPSCVDKRGLASDCFNWSRKAEDWCLWMCKYHTVLNSMRGGLARDVQSVPSHYYSLTVSQKSQATTTALLYLRNPRQNSGFLTCCPAFG